MFVLFILSLIVLVASLIAGLVSISAKEARPWAIGGISVAVVFVFISCIRTVGTKEIGVPTTFGKVGTSHLTAGFHLTSPWEKIHEMDGAIQTADHLDKTCFNVRIANQQTGCAEVSMQWRINPKYVDYDYQNYRSFDHLKTQLVDRKLFSAVNDALASYNPLDSITAGTHKNPLPDFQSKIFKLMKLKVQDVNGRPLITILNVQLPIVHFDSKTQDRINQLQQQVALTRIAGQQLETNRAQSKANAALAKSVNTSPNILVSRCLDILDAMVKNSQSVPAGFSCWPGNGVAAVIAGGTTAGSK